MNIKGLNLSTTCQVFSEEYIGNFLLQHTSADIVYFDLKFFLYRRNEVVKNHNF